MNDAELSSLTLKCWSHNKSVRKKSFEEFSSVTKYPAKAREKMFKLIKRNLNELSEQEKQKVREIANIVMARISDVYAITSSERGFGDRHFYGYIDEINEIYDYDYKLTDSFNIVEVQECLNILEKIGDADSLILIIYGLDFIFHPIPEGNDPLADRDLKSTVLIEKAITGIGERIGKKKVYECVANELASVLLGWIDYGMPEGIGLKGNCLKYSKHYLKWLNLKLRDLGDNSYYVEQGLRIIPALEKRLNSGITY